MHPNDGVCQQSRVDHVCYRSALFSAVARLNVILHSVCELAQESKRRPLTQSSEDRFKSEGGCLPRLCSKFFQEWTICIGAQTPLYELQHELSDDVIVLRITIEVLHLVWVFGHIEELISASLTDY